MPYVESFSDRIERALRGAGLIVEPPTRPRVTIDVAWPPLPNVALVTPRGPADLSPQTDPPAPQVEVPAEGPAEDSADGSVDSSVGLSLEDASGALLAQIEELLKTLTFREREIIRLRYGLADGYSYTLEEVGRIFKVTRERVRQIEAKAVAKLQNPVRSRYLEAFVPGTALAEPIAAAA